jgi:hypothetical protein
MARTVLAKLWDRGVRMRDTHRPDHEDSSAPFFQGQFRPGTTHRPTPGLLIMSCGSRNDTVVARSHDNAAGGIRTHDLTDYESPNSPSRSTPCGH